MISLSRKERERYCQSMQYHEHRRPLLYIREELSLLSSVCASKQSRIALQKDLRWQGFPGREKIEQSSATRSSLRRSHSILLSKRGDVTVAIN